MIVLKAVEFGVRKHGKQVRKFTGEPYFCHCTRVARKIAQCGFGDFTVTAALLHDTLEDTDTTIEELREQFGSVVADYVWWLTKPPLDRGNRELRKRMDRERLSRAPMEAKSIKVADILDNAPGFIANDSEFAPRYAAESRALIASLHGAHSALLTELDAMLTSYERARATG